jgi:uncharacterized protein (TIGR03437 family)
MKPLASVLFIFWAAFLPPASAQTATYTASLQKVTLTGLGGSGGAGQSRVDWGGCAYDGTNTRCTVTAPYTGVGGGVTISIVLAYKGNGISPFTANSISSGSDLVTFGLTAGSSGTISVSLTESTGATIAFLSNNFTFFYDSSASCSGTSVTSNVSSGSQPVVVSTPGGSSKAYPITVNVIEPGLLAPPVFNLNAGQYIGALFPDGVTFVLPPGSISGVASARAKPGDTIVLYGIGFGTVNPEVPAGQIVTQSNILNANFQASFAGTPATVSFSGLTGGYLGLYQFNVVVPSVAPSDTVPLTFSLGGTIGTQKLLISVSN